MCLRRAGLLLALVVGVGCAAASQQVTALPVIDTVTPASGPAGTAYPIEITISGRTFTDTASVVTFGPVRMERVRSEANGTRIVFQAPKASPSTGEVPPAPLLPGTYELRVITGAGTSNAVSFALTREPGGSR